MRCIPAEDTAWGEGRGGAATENVQSQAMRGRTGSRLDFRSLPAASLVSILLVLLGATGCVRRTLRITSDPAGALVWLNDREIGRTPVDFDFLHYGTYDVRLELAGYEPMSTSGQADPPWWDVVGPDLVSELLPMDLRSEILWEYELELAARSRPGLLERAYEMRGSVGFSVGIAYPFPISLNFGFPVRKKDGDDLRTFSFTIGF